MKALTYVLATVIFVPGVAWALPDLTTEDGFLFDPDASTDGGLFNGTFDAFDDYGIGCYALTVNGTLFNAGGAPNDYYGGRGFQTLEMTIGSLHVQRYGYVPETGPSYMRYIDTVRNTGGAAATVTVSYFCDLGSDNGLAAVHTSDSGDATFDTGDSWIETDDVDNGDDPSLGHVFYQPGAEATTATASLDGNTQLNWSYTFSVAAGETGAIMLFVVEQESRAAVHTDLLSALDLADPALAEAGIELDGVRNFVLGGAPLITSGGPYEVEEGGCITMHASVRDREGDEVTFAWDLDGDGVYETEDFDADFCATGIDGPSEASVGVQAADDQGNAVERQVPIHVVNVAPTITSAPGTTAVAGSHYEYQVTLSDPAGAGDPPLYRLTNEDREGFPEGMIFDATGILSWDPREDQANKDFEVSFEVDDGDGGTATQDFGIHVRPNTLPTAPEPAYPTLDDEPVDVIRPTLIVRNASDPDGDALTYSFTLADNVGFVGAVQSGEVPEGDQGATEWAVTYDLVPGTSYYWKVTASDGIGVSDEGFSSFKVDENAEGGGGGDADGDGDGDGGGRRAGCACRTTGTRGDHGWLAVSLAVGALALVRRRRSR